MKFWNDMKIEFLTHHDQEGSTFLVMAKSKVSHRKSKWTKFVNLVQGYRLQMVKVRRYTSPIHEYKDTPLYDEIHKNLYTSEMNGAMEPAPPAESKVPASTKPQAQAKPDPPANSKPQAQAKPDPPANSKPQAQAKPDPPAKRGSQPPPDEQITRLFTDELALARIIPSESKRGALNKAIISVFGPEWSRGNCVNLRVYWLLEVHRRILRLEQALEEARVDIDPLSPQRAQAFWANKYVLIDPLTLGVPILLGHLRGGFDLQADASYRLMAVTASIHPLLRYGMDLTAVARERLRGTIPPAVDGCLFEWPFPFLPEWMRKTLAASPVPNAAANIERRVEKEQVWTRSRPLTRAPRREGAGVDPFPPASPEPTDRSPPAGRRAGAPAPPGGAAEEPAAQDLHPARQARPGAAGRRHAPQAAHAAPAPDAEPAGRRVRPGGVPGPARPGHLSRA
jgi:hypothetical protein